jgi:ribosomal protein S7
MSRSKESSGREKRRIKRIRQVALNLMWSGLKRRSEKKPDAVYIVDTALAHIRDRFGEESIRVSALKITSLIDRIQTDIEDQTRRPPGHGESQFNIYPDKDKWDIDKELLSRLDQPDS